ncbi:hypothetical protein BpHYR1_011285 [Brachionus plicatilis]|uniref:Uncharacterized protein n=1 Tax=Brachionus plicatilis TaxID=10195 RepID=A0A3M7QSP3_BRAPC|nr:hypothetical protein BpHYR1_011285 [Brachionus plicatilis]
MNTYIFIAEKNLIKWKKLVNNALGNKGFFAKAIDEIEYMLRACTKKANVLKINYQLILNFSIFSNLSFLRN